MKSGRKNCQSVSQRSSTAVFESKRKLRSALVRSATMTLIAALAVVVFFISAAEAHTFHTSLTRMDYNAKDKLFEVTIQLFTHDLQTLLEKRLKKRVDLEKTPEVNAEIQKYLADNFVLVSAAGETKKQKWIGREFENDTIYVYLEIPFEGALTGAKLQNTIFFESFPKQTNLVVARFGENKTDFVYKPGDKFKEFTSQTETRGNDFGF